ncbi:MAG: NfeD family protein [Gemmatimonadota bacterium]|nr:NfeD family protein [Gemmatimonadota bacterium]
MDLYIFCVVLGAAGMAAMAFLGFTSSHSAGHHAHDTSGHEMHGIGGAITHSITPAHGIAHNGQVHLTAPAHATAHAHASDWKSLAWSWLSPRVLFNFLVGFGATGLIVERLVGPVLALPIALVGGVGFEAFVVRPIFNSLFRFESQPAQTLESALMSEGRAVTGFDAHGNGLISLELGGELVQVLGTQLNKERAAGVRIRAGDVVRIEEVDGTRNRCTVSRIGLGETESRDADRY